MWGTEQARLRRALFWCSLAALALVGCERRAAGATAAASERVIPVTVTEVQQGPLQRSARAAGVLKEKRELDLAFKIPGIVSRVLVEEGARVKRGQLLAVLDPTEVEAGAAQAEETYLKAQRDLSRAQALHENQGIARSSLDDAQSAMVLARASMQSAAFNLKHAQLVAPADGVIDRRLVEVGEVVAPSLPVLRFKSGLGSVVRVSLVDRDVVSMSLGDLGQVVLDARPEQPFAARVTRIASSITPATGTFEVELTPLEPRVAVALPSGLSAKVTFERARECASLPLTSIVDGDGDRAFVFLVEHGRARRIPIEIDGVEGERVALRTRLSQGVQVVATGAAELRDGAPVHVVEARAGAGEPDVEARSGPGEPDVETRERDVKEH